MRCVLSVFIIIWSCGNAMAQAPDWVEQMQDPNVNFYTVQKNFEDYWSERTVEKGKGWKQFKRWEAFMEPRVYPEGNRPNPSVLAVAFQNFKAQAKNFNGGNWTPVGPYDGNALNGIGRINRLAFDPQNSQIIWAGTPAGGLWKSADGGVNWTTNTDLLPNLGISDIAIHPNNSNIMYIATGDRDGGDTYSYGVLKSTDGGQSWKPTGLSFAVSQQTRIQRLYLNPQNPNILIATARTGVFRSTDAGDSWIQVVSGNYNSLVQKPGDPNILYLGSQSRIYKSINNGVSWSQIPTSSGLPSGGISRLELAVTPDDPNYVYALYGASNNGFLGVYRSIDGGDNWSTRSTSPNLLGWSVSGNDSGGQAWYDLAIAVDPTDKNKIYVGGVNIWTSDNGGSSWSLAAHWYGGGGAPFVHADIHHLTFNSGGGAVYAGCDGGVYRKVGNNNSWDELNQGMNITQYYRLGASATDTALVITGSQDNGTHLYDNTWDRVRGGDGMECAIDPKSPNIMYSSVYYGDFRKSVNRGNSFNANFNLSPAGSGNWVTPFLIDPLHPDTLYAGFSRVYRSYNGGVSFSAVSPGNMTGGQNIDQMAISESDPSFLYVSEGNDLWRSDTRGSTFLNLSSAVPGTNTITYIAVDPDDPLHIVITRSGYSSSRKVYESINGGVNWKNISLNLPNVPANCAVFENNEANGIYVGTDLGVFYKDDNLQEWVPYNSNLPNVIVNELEITYKDRKLKAATYGRGLWLSPLYGDLSAPLAAFEVEDAVCFGDTVTLWDNSSYYPDNWTWNISPSTYTFVNGTNQNSENPQVYFSQRGVYDITLTVSNSKGSSSLSQVSATAVGGFPLPFTENFEDENNFNYWKSADNGESDWERVNVAGNSPGTNAIKADLYFNTGIFSIVSPSLSFKDHDSVKLSFDHSYRGRAGNTDDTLRVYIATNCTDTWVLLQEFTEDGTKNFITRNQITQDFTPSVTADWCGNTGFASCNFLDLSSYDGMEGVRLKFEASSASGNNMFIDNIEIFGTPNAAPTANFSGVQTACALQPVAFTDQSYGSPATYEWTFTGATPVSSSLRNPSPVYPAAGTYPVSLKVINALGSDSTYKAGFITISPADSVSITLSAINVPICSSDTLSVSANTLNPGLNPVYNWYKNGVFISSGSSDNYDYTGLANGDLIYATLQASEVCAYPGIAMSDTITVSVHALTNVQFNQVQALCINDPVLTLAATPAGGVFTGPGVNSGNFDPSIAGAGTHPVRYIYTDINGCSYEETQMVVVNSPATVVLTSPGTVCEGDRPILLNTGYPAGGNYSGPGVTADYFFPDSVSPGTYTITYSYASGTCPATSKSTTIQVLPLPLAPNIALQGNKLESSIAATFYQWYLNTNIIVGANSRSYTPTLNGDYTVEIRDANGCTNISTPYILANVGIEEYSNNTSLKLYPNPANEELHIELDSPVAIDASIVITNTIGQVLLVKSLEISNFIDEEFDISTFPSGMYILSIEGKNISLNRRFFKK